MKIKINFWLSVIILSLPWTVFSQEFTEIKRENKLSQNELGQRVGDKVPNINLGVLINDNLKAKNISELKDKLVILDFWSINCKGCIMSLPHFDSLQTKFGSKIQILPITYEERKTVDNFWRNNPYTKNLSLPSVVEDVTFSKMFKHVTIPHEVWIYKGFVVAITTTEFVDQRNIERILSGEKVSWAVKNDFYNFDINKPLFMIDSNQIGANDASFKYAAIRGYKENINSEGFTGGQGIFRDSKNKTVMARFVNQPIFNSYQIIFARLNAIDTLIRPSKIIDPNQVVWEVRDRSKYEYISKETSGYLQDWLRKNAICFESMTKDIGQTDLEIDKQTVQNMNVLLGINVRWERRKEKVFILKESRIGSSSPYKSKGATSSEDFVYFLNQNQNNPYVFNELHREIQLPPSAESLDVIDLRNANRLLNTYGVELLEVEKMVDKLIFSEIGEGLLPKGGMK